MDVVDSDLGEALRQHEESASLLRVCYVRYNMLLLMRMVEMDATIRLIWRRSEDQEMVSAPSEKRLGLAVFPYMSTRVSFRRMIEFRFMLFSRQQNEC